MLGIVFVVLTNYFRILAPQLTGYVVNTVVQSVQSPNVNEIDLKKSEKNYDYTVRQIIAQFDEKTGNKILYAGITLFVIAIISGFFMFLMRQTIIVMSRHVEYDQKNEIFTHYQKLDTNFYKTHSTGDLMNRIADDVSKVRMYTGPAIMYFINLAAVLGFSIYFMVKASPKLTLVALAPLPVLAIAIYLVNTIINKKSERIQSLLSDLTANAQESYSGIRVIKSFVQENAMMGFFKKNSDSYKDNALSLAKTEAIYFPSMALLIGLSTLITIMVGSLDVVNNVEGASVGRIAEFVMYIQMLTFPVSAIGWTASMTQRAATSQRRINEFLHTEPTMKNEADALKSTLGGNVSLVNVDFIYPHTGIRALKDFSLQINKGEKIAIVGRTGSGKSTIAQLLLHMYEPQKGIINFDGIPINKIDINSLRTQISYVPQDVFLFSETVSNNIRFGLDNATEDAVVAAAKQASIHNEIEKFQQGYKTMIGERGVTLSGGQKQRISIARALLRNPHLLIFDEATSALDSITEEEITNTIRDVSSTKGQITILIAHRLSTIMHADRIYVLEKGDVVETGSHELLLQEKGLYFAMWRQQIGERKRPTLSQIALN